jgi:hypothetical protein
MKLEDIGTENGNKTAVAGQGKAVSFSFLPGRFRHQFSVDGINNRVFFAAILLYHIAITFQGIDLLDEGFHATLYQRIFSDPASVEYGFFYWFSGIAGGFILKLVPFLGLWGLRMGGVLVSLSTIYISYRMLRNVVPRGIWQIAIVLLALNINNEPKDIHYNNLSALIYFLSAWLMFLALKGNKAWMLLFSGALVSFNVFTRLPNILGVGLALAIIYEGFIRKRKISQVIAKLAYFTVGFLLTTVTVLGIMKSIEHYDYYVDSLNYLKSVNTVSQNKDGLNGYYSTMQLILKPTKQHLLSIAVIVFLGAFLVFSKIFADEAKKISIRKWRADLLLWSLISVALLGIIFTDRIVIKDLTYLFTGLCTVTAAIYLLGAFSYEEKLLSALGLLIVLIHPLGSGVGIGTVMIYSLWLSFPMAIKMIFDVFGQDIILDGRWGHIRKFSIRFEQSFLSKVMLWAAAMVMVVCVRHIFVYPYFFDKHNRFTMFYNVHSDNTKLIYTSKGRADILNELLVASGKYVKKGDPVLAYDAFPLYHFMTETKPFLSSSAPIYYTTDHFENEMRKSTIKFGLPVVIRQKIWMVHDGSTWPEIIFKGDNLQEPMSAGRNKVFNQFLQDNKYQEVWSNQVFSIMLPGINSKPLE